MKKKKNEKKLGECFLKFNKSCKSFAYFFHLIYLCNKLHYSGCWLMTVWLKWCFCIAKVTLVGPMQCLQCNLQCGAISKLQRLRSHQSWCCSSIASDHDQLWSNFCCLKQFEQQCLIEISSFIKGTQMLLLMLSLQSLWIIIYDGWLGGLWWNTSKFHQSQLCRVFVFVFVFP